MFQSYQSSSSLLPANAFNIFIFATNVVATSKPFCLEKLVKYWTAKIQDQPIYSVKSDLHTEANAMKENTQIAQRI